VDERLADVRVTGCFVARAYPDEIFYGNRNFVSTIVQGAMPTSGTAGGPRCFRSSSSSSSSAKKTTHHHAN